MRKGKRNKKLDTSESIYVSPCNVGPRGQGEGTPDNVEHVLGADRIGRQCDAQQDAPRSGRALSPSRFHPRLLSWSGKSSSYLSLFLSLSLCAAYLSATLVIVLLLLLCCSTPLRCVRSRFVFQCDRLRLSLFRIIFFRTNSLLVCIASLDTCGESSRCSN